MDDSISFFINPDVERSIKWIITSDTFKCELLTMFLVKNAFVAIHEMNNKEEVKYFIQFKNPVRKSKLKKIKNIRSISSLSSFYETIKEFLDSEIENGVLFMVNFVV